VALANPRSAVFLLGFVVSALDLESSASVTPLQLAMALHKVAAELARHRTTSHLTAASPGIFFSLLGGGFSAAALVAAVSSLAPPTDLGFSFGGTTRAARNTFHAGLTTLSHMARALSGTSADGVTIPPRPIVEDAIGVFDVMRFALDSAGGSSHQADFVVASLASKALSTRADAARLASDPLWGVDERGNTTYPGTPEWYAPLPDILAEPYLAAGIARARADPDFPAPVAPRDKGDALPNRRAEAAPGAPSATPSPGAHWTNALGLTMRTVDKVSNFSADTNVCGTCSFGLLTKYCRVQGKQWHTGLTGKKASDLLKPDILATIQATLASSPLSSHQARGCFKMGASEYLLGRSACPTGTTQ